MPRVGPCEPWITATDLQTLPDLKAIGDVDLADSATIASDLLYKLSGEQFTGAGCGPVKVRPVARPTDQDRGWLARAGAGAWYSSWGSCNAFGLGNSGTFSHYGCTKPPEVDLGAYPVTNIVTVLIDGVVIPSTEYFVQDYRRLVRLRPTATAIPTERYGWPTCQSLDLPDTEPGTFSVSFTYGVAPPLAGIEAARELATELALSRAGKPNRLPTRITSLTRQGVTAAAIDSMDFLKLGKTGLYFVDLFIGTYNPHGTRRKPIVWSPDRGRPRRLPAGQN